MQSIPRRAYYSSSAASFVAEPAESILGQLVERHSFDTDEAQRDAWIFEINHLQGVLKSFPEAHLYLEFSIPRMGKRADAIVVYRGVVLVLEYKVVGRQEYRRADIQQVLDYALDLKDFHEGSRGARLIPVLLVPRGQSRPPVWTGWADGVNAPVLCNEGNLPAVIQEAAERFQLPQIDPVKWASSGYKPTPTIIEAAQALYHGHSVEEISRSEAGAGNLARTADYIGSVIDLARKSGTKTICFITGVPGSGKTLAGLNIVTERLRAHQEEHAVLLSGNGPLVDVIRAALEKDAVKNKRRKKGGAQRDANAIIQNIHHFRDEYVENPTAPPEKVVVFDEAQRAWNLHQTSDFMRRKRKKPNFSMSEPHFLLSVMDRHKDWCCVICLVGGGQEINRGEAGLGEWLDVLASKFSHWQVHVSDRLNARDYLGAVSPELALARSGVSKSASLHLGVSVRSFRAEALSELISTILEGESDRALRVGESLVEYPLAVTRDLEAARNWLREKARGSQRTGLVASSKAQRLKPLGIHVKAPLEPAIWFLAEDTDVRSSYALEDAASEFDVQGLELDWVGVCWDANLRWVGSQWQCWNFRGAKWERVNDQTAQKYLINSYRVLLTRARQGMVIVVPAGSELDGTRDPAFYDGTYRFLLRCGIPALP